MGLYRHLLAAVEIHDEGERVLARAKELAGHFDARLSVIHVVEYLPVDPAGDALLAAPIDLSAERAQQARSRLLGWCEKLAITAADAEVVIGAVTVEIVRAAQQRGADLILIGHHPRRGLSSLFTHTDDGVLQRAGCDVLALNLAARGVEQGPR